MKPCTGTFYFTKLFETKIRRKLTNYEGRNLCFENDAAFKLFLNGVWLSFIVCPLSWAWIPLKSCRVPEKIRSTGQRPVLGAEIAQRDGCRKGKRKTVKTVKKTKERDTCIGSGERSRTLRRGRRQNQRKRARTKVRLNFLRLAGPAGVKWERVCYTRCITHESRNERPRRLCTKDSPLPRISSSPFYAGSFQRFH